MPVLKLTIDVAGTTGDQAWRELRHFEQLQEAHFGHGVGGSPCGHAPAAPHPPGEWLTATVHIPDPLLAQYAVSHYLEQPRVLDVDVEN